LEGEIQICGFPDIWLSLKAAALSKLEVGETLLMVKVTG
jgi:hypothetical protein